MIGLLVIYLMFGSAMGIFIFNKYNDVLMKAYKKNPLDCIAKMVFIVFFFPLFIIEITL